MEEVDFFPPQQQSVACRFCLGVQPCDLSLTDTVVVQVLFVQLMLGHTVSQQTS